jgi:hypothetical protein
MQTATIQPTRFHLTTIALWPFSIAILFIALNQFVNTGTLPATLTLLWAVGVFIYWLFISSARRIVTQLAPGNGRNLLQATLIVGGVIYTIIFLLVAFGR